LLQDRISASRWAAVEERGNAAAKVNARLLRRKFGHTIVFRGGKQPEKQLRAADFRDCNLLPLYSRKVPRLGGVASSVIGEARPGGIVMRISLALGLFLVAMTAVAAPHGNAKPRGQAPAGTDIQREDYRSKMNANVVTIMAGSPNGTDLGIAYDIARVVDDGDNLRVLPIVGKGAAQSVKDVMFLKGVDMGITQANIIKYFARSGELGANLVDKIVYVAKLFTEEVHIIVRSDVTDVKQLNGKIVNFGEEGSGTDITARLVLDALGVNVQKLHLSDPEAIEKLKSGEIAAVIVMAGKPAPELAPLKGAEGLKFLRIPYAKELEDAYYPAILTHDDYPELISAGESVDTVSVCTVLVAFNWSGDNIRYKRVAKFVDAFFSKFDAFLQPTSNPKWREVNFAATLEGWHRSPASQAWIDSPENVAGNTGSFDSFLAHTAQVSGKPVSDAERADLFRAFLEWNKNPH
jgi:TRAP transporter TAXI family solute receptor